MSKKRRLRRSLEDLDDLDEVLHPSENASTNAKGGLGIRNKYTLNQVHQTFFDLCVYNKTKMVFVDGSAGTAKTYIAVLAGLTLLQTKQVKQIVYIRSIVESATKSIGALPGEVDEKFKPWSLPMLDKLHELVTPTVASSLIEEGLIKCIPVNFVRGLTFHDSLVIIDEAQNLTKSEIVTILTRFGHNSRYVVIGDTQQSDIGNKSGFPDIVRCFDDEESQENNIHVCKFGENEIVRSQILKFIVRKLGC
jgi:phosphate starvation-inducible PhoH-like protein